MAPVSDLIDVPFLIPQVTPLTLETVLLSLSLHPPLPLTSSPPLSDKGAKGKGGGETESEGMYGCSANTFICAQVMGAAAATVSHGNDLCGRLASKWAKNELNSQ